MKRKNKISALAIQIFILLLVISGCKKGDESYYNYENDFHFDGSLLSYLEKQPNTFDSLVLLLDYHPELKNKLDTGSHVTFFAPTNNSFVIALNNLNTQRKLKGLAPMFLEDLPSSLIDELLCRYLFTEEYDAEGLFESMDGETINSFKHAYPMNMRAIKLATSGMVGTGPAQIEFSDTNGLPTEKDWLKAMTNQIDIITNNGILHVINPYHEFGYGNIAKKILK